MDCGGPPERGFNVIKQCFRPLLFLLLLIFSTAHAEESDFRYLFNQNSIVDVDWQIEEMFGEVTDATPPITVSLVRGGATAFGVDEKNRTIWREGPVDGLGEVTGNSGCQNFEGRFEIQDGVVSLWNLGSPALKFSRIDNIPPGCVTITLAEVQQLIQREKVFFDALEAVHSWQIDEDEATLTLLDEHGGTVLLAKQKPDRKNPSFRDFINPESGSDTF